MKNTVVNHRQLIIVQWRCWLLPSIEGIVVLAIFLMVLILGNRLLQDPDTGWHIRSGDYMLAQMEVPRTDIFSYRKFGQPWVAHEWLADVAFAVVHQRAGLNGIVVLSAFIIATTFMLLFRLIGRCQDNTLVTVLVTILSAVTTSIHWLARPHLFSLCLTVMWYSALESHQQAPKRYHLFLFPSLMILWVNLHGSFLFGFAMLGIYGLANFWQSLIGDAEARPCRRKFVSLSIIGVVCLLASLVNPYSYRLLLFPLEILNATEAMSTISEWQSPDFHRLGSFEFYLLLMILTFLARTTKTTLIEICLILFSIHISLVAKRYIPLFAILMAPLLARRLHDLYRTFVCHSSSPALLQTIHRGILRFVDRFQSFNSNLKSPLIPTAVAIVVIVATFNGGKVFGKSMLAYEFSGTQYPIRAVEFIKKNAPPGNMFNYYSYGGYLIYTLFPDPRYRVYVDGRAIVGGADYYTDYLDVIYLTSRWKELLQRDDVNWILYPANAGLSMVLLDSPAWKLIYNDGEANIFVRNSPENQSIISKFSGIERN